METDESFSEEQAPLLDAENIPRKISTKKDIKNEFLQLLKIAIPIIVTNLSAFLILTESIMISGHLTKTELDACSLANSIINVAGIAIGTGLCTACDTFFSQMYGSKHRKSIGVVLIRSIMIISLFPVVLVALHINIEPIFILMGQDIVVSQQASVYMLLFSPGLLFGFNFLILTRYMQNQNRVLPPMIIGVTVNIFNVISQFLTVHYLNFGIKASAICQAITFFLFWFLELSYILCSKMYEESWNGWTREVFLNWTSFIRLAIPGALMVVLESFCFEIGTILSGIMGPLELAAQSIMFQFETITFMISFGVGIAVNIRVGQYLGLGQWRKAVMAYRCGIGLIFISYSITTALVLGFMNMLPRLFTNDKEAQELSTQLIPFLVGVQFFDAMGTVTMGALRGCGRQKICVLLIFCSYYLLGQPIGISLSFLTPLKVKGLWIGWLISLAICVPVAVIYTNFVQDWHHQQKLCQERIQSVTNQQETEEVKNNLMESNLSASREVFFTSHRRSLSKSFSAKFPGDIVVVKYIEIAEVEYKKAYINRSLVFLATICVLLGGVFLHLYLPRSTYLPNSNKTAF